MASFFFCFFASREARVKKKERNARIASFHFTTFCIKYIFS